MSSTESEDEHEPKKKRTCNPSSYKRNIIKNSKVKGKEHTNWRGNKVTERKTGPDCKCKRLCFIKFHEENFQFCIKTMNNFSSKDEQDIYLQQHIEKGDVKQRRMRTENGLPRQGSFQIFVSRTTTKVQVCKKAFTSVYGIREGRVRRLCNLLMLGKSPRDRRGEHPKANTKLPEICYKIHEHILSFPREKTHYSGKDIEYLDSRLDIKLMHSMFKKIYPDLDINYKFYLKYFKENFALRFGRPQVGTCITCEQLSVKIKSPSLSQDVKRTYAGELMVHKRRAKKFYNKISFLPNDRDFGVIKKNIRKHDRVYVPDEYYKIVNESSAKFSIKELQRDEVYEFKKWWTSYYKKSCLSVESYGKKVPKDQKYTFSSSSYMSFEYDATRKGTVVTHDFIDGLNKHTFQLLKNYSVNVSLPSIKAYNSKVPINSKKIDNFKQAEGSIIHEHSQIYQEIFNWSTEEDETQGRNVESDGEYNYVP